MEGYNQRPIDTGQMPTPTSSLQELPFHSPEFTLYEQLPEKLKGERVRQLERGYSMETHDRPTYSEEMRRAAEERKRDERERVASNEEVEHRKPRIQRQPPVHLTRIRPPSYVIQRKTKTLEARTDTNTRPPERHPVMEVLDPPRTSCASPPGSTSSRLPKPDKKSWLDKIRSMKRS
ncbi:hypothetical protein COOONC_17246 [Cooperia oncophora]